jgi:hypothetical protein
LGQVESLRQSFTIKDVTTGDRVVIDRSRPPYYGAVVGRYCRTDAAKRLKTPERPTPLRRKKTVSV